MTAILCPITQGKAGRAGKKVVNLKLHHTNAILKTIIMNALNYLKTRKTLESITLQSLGFSICNIYYATQAVNMRGLNW